MNPTSSAPIAPFQQSAFAFTQAVLGKCEGCGGDIVWQSGLGWRHYWTESTTEQANLWRWDSTRRDHVAWPA